MTLEGLHNKTGKWLLLSIIDDDEGFRELAQEQIEEFAKGGNQHLILWNTPVNTHHFSAFRLTP